MRVRLRRFMIWGFLFVLAVLIGATIFAYTYITDSDTLATLINSRLPKYFPGSQLRVDRVQVRPLLGQVDISLATLIQPVDGQPFSTARVAWLQARCEMQALWKGRIEPREVVVAQPTLRLKRRRDGSWNLQGLLANPWPTDLNMRPVVRVLKGMVELVNDNDVAMLLHDVELTFEPDGAGRFRFEGSARGDAFQRLVIAGALDTTTGRVWLSRADVAGLTISDALRQRLPEEWLAAWDELGLTAGQLDVTLDAFDSARGADRAPHYEMRIGLHGGVWNCRRLPFPVSNVTAAARIEDGHVTVQEAEARYGKTDIYVHKAAFQWNGPDPTQGPLELDVSVRELELDGRLREQLPEELRAVWDQFTLEGRDDLGRISLRARFERVAQSGPLSHAVTIDLLDAAICYERFRFPLEHMRGRMFLVGDTLTIEEVQSLAGTRPMIVRGQIEGLGGDPSLSLDVEAEAMPVDESGPLVCALPIPIRDLVTEFHPTGTVRGTAHIERKAGGDQADDWGDVRVDATLDLNEDQGCSIRWDGLPYPVYRMAGRLELHPDGCTFRDMRGENGVARVAGSGRVVSVGADRFAADIALQAERLPFDEQLRKALPPEWRATWGLLNPIGTSSVNAHVVANWPERADQTLLKIRLKREDEARVKLVIRPAPGTPVRSPGQSIELPPMQGVTGDFTFDNGLVTMSNVAFGFRTAPVSFRAGRMNLQSSGAFGLRVEGLGFSGLLIDAELRRIMPPLMGEFAKKLKENQPVRASGNLTIGWSGKADDPAVCSWDNAKVILQDITIYAHAGTSIDHIHGELSGVQGRSDGRTLSFSGLVDVESLEVAGLQIAPFRSRLIVGDGKARLPNIDARVLDGRLTGALEISLDTTPEYHASLDLTEANLARFAEALPGRQELSGKLSGGAILSGTGGDLRSLAGSGHARLWDADLGKLPWFLRLVSPLNQGRESRAAFDSANVSFVIKDGGCDVKPIKITGNAISLQGAGSINSQWELDLSLKPLAGRDERLHIPGLSDLAREATGQVFQITAKGPLGNPTIGWTPLPGPTRRVVDFMRGGNDRPRDRILGRAR